jgi:hypothetical protein
MQAQVPPKVGNFYQLTLHHITEKLNVHQDCCEDIQHHTALEDEDVVCHCTLHILTCSNSFKLIKNFDNQSEKQTL